MKASEIVKLITRAILLFLILLLTGMKTFDAFNADNPYAPTATQILASLLSGEDNELLNDSKALDLETEQLRRLRIARTMINENSRKKMYHAEMRKHKASEKGMCVSGVAMMWTNEDGSSGGHVFNKHETDDLVVMGRLIGKEEFEKVLDRMKEVPTKQAIAMLHQEKQEFLGPSRFFVAEKKPPKKLEKSLESIRVISYSPADDEVRLNLVRKNY